VANSIAENELPTDACAMLDADASYRMPVGRSSIFLFVKGSNLLDEDARQHTSPLKDIAPLRGQAFHIGARAEF
jgi:iron complex outermembrane recepter protein